jgi:RNA-binding protein PNO1|uniref:K Homology domain-containing protein n=1 Tax=Globisporangium ultimum (strain ATCC 200006 / CBS 805.95 / DAOM BR144) TaxID=431595 RepID=K3WKW4_GLOUD
MEVDSVTAGQDVVINAQDIEQVYDDSVEVMGEYDPNTSVLRPSFPALSAQEQSGGKNDFRRVRVPAHRYTPLKNDWPNIMKPIVEHLRLQIRMNTKTRCIELKNSEHTIDAGALQKAADFVQAYMMGFEVQDAVALLRLEDLFLDTFEINDVKMLKGDHLSRAIGRVAGQDGKTKYAVENATRTRIVLADQKIHILGSFANIKLARDAICSLIMGAPPGKVYNKMRSVASRMNERF